MTKREIAIHSAKVHLSEARNRRACGDFYWILLAWARNARLRAQKESDPQGELF